MMLVSASAVAPDAAELEPETVRAFDRYVELTEERMRAEVEGPSPFLWLDRLDAAGRDEVLARRRSGEVVIERLRTRDGGAEVDTPSGMVHHWIGIVLIPGATLDRTIALVQDYDCYPEVYAPDVRASAIRSRAGDRFEVYLRLYTRKILTWVADTEHRVEFLPVGDTRMHVPSRSTRILEIEHPDTPRERAKPEGNDRGFAWRLNHYSRSRSGTRAPSCSASRSPSPGASFLLGVVVRPFVTGVPREKLTLTLDAARRHLTAGS